jgi:DNA-binding CsgD family transcriptional regulator
VASAPLNLSSEDLTSRIYEASVLPECWPDVLSRVNAVVGGVGTLLVASRQANLKITGSSPGLIHLAGEYFTKYDFGNERTRRLMAVQRAGFVADSECFSDAEIAAEPVFRDFLTPRGLGGGIGTAIQLQNHEVLLFHTERLHASPPVDKAVVSALDDARPHLARAALLSARLDFERARTAVETLSAMGLAACALADAGTVLIGNDEFSAEPNLWTTRGGGRIALFDRRADRLLYQALGMIGSERGTRSIPLCDEQTGAPAVIHIVPVRRSALDLFSRCAAILVLTKLVDKPAKATPLLKALFDLTSTEADLAARIAAGQTAAEVAAREDKSVSTVRNQLKSVLEKTGCRRQADLARLLAQLVLVKS